MGAVSDGVMAATRLANRLRGMVSRAVIGRVNEALQVRGVQIEALAGEGDNWIEHLEPYGLTGRPASGSDAIVIHVGGSRAHRVVIGVAQRGRRPTDLDEYDVAVYDGRGNEVHLQAGGVVIATAGTIELTEGATEALVRGDSFRALYNGHTHTAPAGGGLTTVPTTLMTTTHLSGKVYCDAGGGLGV